jgi:integrase/recombinase XerD
MSDPSRVRVTGPLTSFAEGFAAELAKQGYRPNAAANQLQLLAHLSRWLGSKRLDAPTLTASVLNEFLAARRSQGYTLWLSPKALAPLVGYLRGLGFVVPEAKAALSPTETLLARYRRYLLDRRGLVATSARGYVDMVRPFVETRILDGELDWMGLSPEEVIEFVRSGCRGRSIGSAKLTVTALRSLLRYLHVEGLVPRPLDAAVPSVAGWRLAGLPRSLEPGEVKHLLAVATQMVRSGVALPEVAQVLRHRRLITTAIYAKVDRERLRLLARPWPGGAP